MDWNELKKLCEGSIRFSTITEDQIRQYKREIASAKRFYDNGRDLYEEFENKRESIQTQYVIPFLLGFTERVTEGDKNYVQVSNGASGGIDIDTDWQGEGRERIYNYLVEKYGNDCVSYVGTFSALGPASAVKDLARVYAVGFEETNQFTAVLQKELTWEENLQVIRAEHPVEYQIYQKHKQVFDLVPDFIGKIRQSGKHAGGIVVTPKPIWNYVPVDRVNGKVATAFPESGSEQVLDELGIVKYDILGISILDVISDAVDMITEELYLIEDDDGIVKVVPHSYVDAHIAQF